MIGGSVKKHHKCHSWDGQEWINEIPLTLPRTRVRIVITVHAEWTSNTRGINIPLSIPLAGPSSLKPSRSFLLLCILVAAATNPGGKSKKGGDSWLTSFLHNNLEAPPREDSGGCCCWGEDEWISGPFDVFFGREKTHKTRKGKKDTLRLIIHLAIS